MINTLLKKKIVFVSAIIIVVIIVELIILVLGFRKPAETSIDTTDQSKIKIVVNGKELNNPTFDDMGFSIQSGTTYERIAKIVKVYKNNSEVTADVQANKDSGFTYNVLFYKDNLVHTLFWKRNSSYPLSTEVSEGFHLKNIDAAYNELTALKNKGILLYIETDDQGNKSIDSYIDCNKIWSNLMINKSIVKINCTPLVRSFIEHTHD